MDDKNKFATGWQATVDKKSNFFFFKLADWLIFLQLYPEFDSSNTVYTPVVATRQNLTVVTVGVFRVEDPALNTYISNFL